MKVLILFAAVLAVASAINPAAIYRSKCSEGASYWCKSASHADECGAVEYCIQNFWRGKIVQESTACQDCEAFVNAAHNVLEQTTVQEDIIDGMKQACVVMESLSDLCQTLVETLGAEVLQQLVTELTADEVCHVLQFCQEKTSIQTTVNDNEVCTLCKDAMSEANALIANVATQQEIENMLLQFCPLVAAILPDCAQLVQDEFPVVVQFLLTYLNPESCTEIGICPGGNKELQNLFVQLMKLKNREGADLCTMCKNTMGTVDAMLSNAAIQTAVRLELDQLCYTLGTFAPVCLFAVNKYSSEIIAAIAAYMNPDTFCPEFRFCPSDQNVHVGVDMCTDCKTFIADIDGMLTNQTVQNLIIADVDMICDQLGDFAAQCKSYVDQYGYIVFDFLASQLSPVEVCTDIQFCTAAPERMTKNLFSIVANIMTVLKQPRDIVVGKKTQLRGPSKVCTDCEQFFTDVQTKLSDPNIQNTIVNAVESMCTLFGQSADECRSYVEQYGGVVIQFIVSSIDPDTVCNDLGFCMSSARPSIPKLMKKKVTGPSKVCTDCDQFFTDVQTKLSDPNIQNTIVNAVENVCTLFGPSADECRSYVEQYGGLVVQFIVSSMDPDTICNDIGFCMSASLLKQKLTFTADTCTDCKAFFTDIDNMLMNQTVESMITADLVNLCDEFGGSFAAQCKMYISQYATLVFSLIASELDPDQICAAIQFCPAEMALKFKEPRIDNSQVCTLCETTITAVETYVASQANQAMIVQELDAVLCANMGIFSVQCKSLVKTYTPLVINIVLSYMDPTTLCTEIKLCPGTSTLKIIADPQFCSDCKTFIGDIDAFISNQTIQTEILTQIEGLCSLAGSSLEPECKLMVETYGPAAFAFILTELDPTTDCTDLGLCPGTSAPRISETDPQLCSDCKNFLTDIDAILSNQTIQNDVIAQLEGLCSLAGGLQAECKLLVETYGPAAFAYILAELDPTTACTEIGVCPGNSAPVISPRQLISLLPAVQPMATLHAARPIPHKETPKVTDTECDLCKTIVGLFMPYIENNKTVEEILNAVSEVCDLLPESSRQACKNYVSTYGYLIIELLENELSPEAICKEIGQCTSVTKVMDTKPVKHLKQLLSKLPTDGTFCTLCEIGIAELETMLSSNKSKEEIKQDVEKFLCGNLPAPINAQCLSFMEIYGDVLVQLLIDQLEPTSFCAEIGLCDAKKQLAKRKVSPLKLNPECPVCEFMISELEGLITENSTETEIRDALKEVCSLLPSTLTSECDSLITTYTEEIVHYLLLKYNPKALCTAIGACGAGNKVVVPKKNAITEQCILCEYIMSEVDKLLTENSTEAEIKAALDDVCSYLPATLRSECTGYVSKYFDVLFSFLTQELDPKTFCTLIGECASAKLTVKDPSVECAICEYAMAEIDSVLKENATQAEIKAALDGLCADLPATIRTECVNFVDTYEPILVKLLVTESPEQICTLIALCRSQKSLKARFGTLECDLCQTTVREFMIAIQEPSVSKEIVAIINDTCAILPADLKAECYTYVNQYGDLVTQFIAQFFDPITSCTLLDACPYPDNSPVTSKQLLGQHECTRGPGFWCASIENAQHCNMVEHCKRHAWN